MDSLTACELNCGDHGNSEGEGAASHCSCIGDWSGPECKAGPCSSFDCGPGSCHGDFNAQCQCPGAIPANTARRIHAMAKRAASTERAKSTEADSGVNAKNHTPDPAANIKAIVRPAVGQTHRTAGSIDAGTLRRAAQFMTGKIMAAILTATLTSAELDGRCSCTDGHSGDHCEVAPCPECSCAGNAHCSSPRVKCCAPKHCEGHYSGQNFYMRCCEEREGMC